ncbi:MAG: sensor histidine kinase [Thermocrispum sp.]
MVERTVRVAAPAALALFTVIGAATSQRPLGVTAVVGLGVLVVAAVIAQRDLTGWPLVGGLAMIAAGLVAVMNHLDSGNLGWFGMCILAAWAALRAPGPPAVVTGAALVGTFAMLWLAPGAQSGWGAWMAGTSFTTVACMFSRRQRELLGQLRQAQAGLAEKARTEERARIAGEMHDVIGHALTVSLLHVSSARLALDDDPGEARAALEEAERLARESLDEVRAAVGLMRAADPSGVRPMPSGADLTDLVESFRRAGGRVELDVRGDLGPLGATRGLAVYRIVQESLTNAARHGDGSPVTVEVDVAGAGTMVTVVSGGSARHSATDGLGLVSMRERVEALGGRLQAGPTPGGWRVEVALPS